MPICRARAIALAPVRRACCCGATSQRPGCKLEAWDDKTREPAHRRLVGPRQPRRQRHRLAPSRRAGRVAGGQRPTALARAFSSPGPARPRAAPSADDAPPREDEAVNTAASHRRRRRLARPGRSRSPSTSRRARASTACPRPPDAESGRYAEGLEAAWLGKGQGHGRAPGAAVLALLDWSRNVSPRACCRAPSGALIVQSAEPPVAELFPPACPRRARSRRAVGFRAPGAPRRALAEGRRRKRTQVSRTEVRVQALGKTVNAARAELVLGRLWAAGLVRPAAHEPLPQGGRPPQRWEVNPALATT